MNQPEAWLAIAPTNDDNLFIVTTLFENFLHELAVLLQLILECVAILVILLAVISTIRNLLRRRKGSVFRRTHTEIRLNLGLSLGLSLEFLLAADVVGTAISPSWDAIAKLAAIAGIRTFLNFFLEKEVSDLEHRVHPGRTDLHPWSHGQSDDPSKQLPPPSPEHEA